MVRTDMSSVKIPLILSGLLILSVTLFPAPAGASPPAREAFFVDIDGTAAVARQYFRETDAMALRKSLTGHINPRPQMRNPFGARFVALGMSGSAGVNGLGKALSVLWAVSCKAGDCGAFKSFLAALGKRTRVRAMISSRKYSGCAEALFELSVPRRKPHRLSVTLSSRQFFHCSRAARKPLTTYLVPLK